MSELISLPQARHTPTEERFRDNLDVATLFTPQSDIATVNNITRLVASGRDCRLRIFGVAQAGIANGPTSIPKFLKIPCNSCHRT